MFLLSVWLGLGLEVFMPMGIRKRKAQPQQFSFIRKYYITIVHNYILSDIRVNKWNVMNMEAMVKKRIAVTITEELLKWVDTKVKDTTFANRKLCTEGRRRCTWS